MSADLWVGVMSGTSMDGLDVAVLRIVEPPDSGSAPLLGAHETTTLGSEPAPPSSEPAPAALAEAVAWELVAFRSIPYDASRRRFLREAVEEGGAAELCELNVRLGRWIGEAVRRVLDDAGVERSRVAAVGSHGHTVWHAPPRKDRGRPGATLQLGDAATVAELTGLPVVSDFRSADVAAWGHGAPLVAWPDRLLFSLPGRARTLQNLGGVGNVTWLPPRGDDAPVLAFDTGPGNGLVDAAARLATADELDYDHDGELAARGTVDEELLSVLLEQPFLGRPPPRSTGREEFGPELVRALAGELGLEPGSDLRGWTNLLATLTLFTARTVADAHRRWIAPRPVDEVVLTGGGAHNPEMVRRIEGELSPLPVRTGADALGMDPDAREAAAFAVLAWARARGLPANVPGATGARGPRVLGTRTAAPGRGRGRDTVPGRDTMPGRDTRPGRDRVPQRDTMPERHIDSEREGA